MKATVCSWDDFISWLETPEPVKDVQVNVTEKGLNGDVSNGNGVKSLSATKSRSMSRLRGMFLRPKVGA